MAQGAVKDPAYATAMNVCLNGFPLEQQAWTRRPGTQHNGTTRGGVQGILRRFGFEEQFPYNIEFTAGHMRFLAGRLIDALATTNDSVVVSSISTANPAVATLATAVTWATGDQGYFTLLGTRLPVVCKRVACLL